MDDFVTFSEAGKAEDDEDAGNFVDEEEEGEEYGLSSNKPPTTITKNADCDWYVSSHRLLCVVVQGFTRMTRHVLPLMTLRLKTCFMCCLFLFFEA